MSVKRSHAMGLALLSSSPCGMPQSEDPSPRFPASQARERRPKFTFDEFEGSRGAGGGLSVSDVAIIASS